jgi:methylated-DNA-[protein]-cysteine S-methyltransferase
MRLWLERWTAPAVGDLLLVTDNDGTLRGLEFAENEARLRRLLGVHYRDCALEAGDAPASLKRALSAYFDGDVDALSHVPTATNGTTFQRQVWAALRAIPAGTTLSYGQLAEKLGRKGASRAVGAANGANPIPIVVPCHRVIGADGSLTGFASGLDRKRWLLDHEAQFAPTSSDV